MIVQKRSLGWLPRASLYAEAEAARLKRKASHESFLGTQDSLSSAVTSIQADYTTGLGNLIGNIAAARLGLKKTA